MNLELTHSLQDGLGMPTNKSKRATLFGVLDQTYTPMGGMAMRGARGCTMSR